MPTAPMVVHPGGTCAEAEIGKLQRPSRISAITVAKYPLDRCPSKTLTADPRTVNIMQNLPMAFINTKHSKAEAFLKLSKEFSIIK